MDQFPADFRWGVSTSSYQIEGAVTEDGRGASIWDTFSHQPDRIGDATTGDVACDHYHRYAEDVALMADLGVRAYRFSIAWPRVQPTGSGPANPAGLAFYDRLVDSLLERGIEPAATLFHWDLPQALQDAGGWTNRDTAARFGEYADLAARALGDRVRLWLTLNEPIIHFTLGHLLGLHAPGVQLLDNPFPVVHHQLLGHGLAAAAIRQHGTGAVSIANNYSPAWPVGADGTRAGADDSDRAAAAVYDAFHNRLFTDPLLHGRYPDGVERLPGADLDSIVLDGDLEVISAPLDALGVNYYNPTGVRAPGHDGPLPFELTQLSGYPTTAFGWPVVPEGLTEILVTLKQRYGDRLPPIWITENGCCYDDGPGPDGSIVDTDRITYLDGHVRALRAAMDAGVRVDGYCLWSLMDNWEWAEGFTKRFGLVHVDFDTQGRTPKASYAWYRDLIARSS
ncbi:GH1 family beta-glucosidase [Planosporangium mesophilum]|uniref:Beta-glucosidase n=1 Tax=Planosporangium mesophilum TaxID=689768 RepID=A0A8J3X024_9ACTN|nr:GH1 family beta-glucosidase [Planosporangium mesophilum]NJC85843.1 beta-glucosidase [Planosporangium mesophilum]GII21904.1 beta-glucosidase [Planosporangium mesophilum]